MAKNQDITLYNEKLGFTFKQPITNVRVNSGHSGVHFDSSTPDAEAEAGRSL